jgi:hypothetical protein
MWSREEQQMKGQHVVGIRLHIDRRLLADMGFVEEAYDAI